MKLSIFKKMALLLVGLATVQGYASNDGYVYSRLSDKPSVYGNTSLTKVGVGSLINYSSETINGFYQKKSDLSFIFSSFYGKDDVSIDRRIIFHGFGIGDKYDYYGFWGRYKPNPSTITPYEAYYGFCDASLPNNCESTLIADQVIEVSGKKGDFYELNLSEYLGSLIASGRKLGYKKIRIAVADLQYWSLDSGDWTTEPDIADEMRSVSNHPTYTHFIDIDIPFVDATVRPERGSGYTICDDSPSHCASNNIVDAIGGSVKIRVAYTAISDFSYKVVNESDMDEPLVSGDVKGDGPLSNEMVLTIPINRKPGENVYSFKFCTAPYGTSEYSCTDGNVGVFVKNGFEMKPERGFGYTICEDSPSHCASNNIVDVIGNSVKTRVLYSTTSSFSYKVVNTSDMDDALVSGDVEGDGLLSNEMVLTIPIDRKSGKDSYTFKFCTASLGSSEYSCLPGSVSAFVKYGAEMKPERGYGYTICEDSPTNCATNNVVDVDGDNIKVRAVYSFLSGFSYKIVNTSEMDKTLVSGEVEENDALSGEIVLSIPVERKVGVTYYGFKLCTAPINSLDYTCEDEVVGAFLKYTPFAVTFLDFDGKKLLTTVAEAGDDLVDRAPEVKTKDDTEKFHYFVKWMQISQEDAGEVTYKATLDSVLKDPKVVVKVENLYVGSKMKISTPTPCIELEGAQLDPDDYKRILDKENNLSYIEGVDKVQNYTLEAWDWSWYQYDLNLILRLLEDGECADDIIVKTIRYNVEKDDDFVFYVNDHKGQFFFDPNADDEIYATPWLQFHATYGAIDYAYGKSRAIIDGASMAPVLESVNGLTAGDVRFNRDFKAGKYSTIMLPFSTEVSKLADADHASFYGISDIVKVDGKWQVQVAAVSDIEANTPYIVVSDVDLDVLIIEDNVTFNTTEGSKSSTAGDWQFVGTYEYKKWTEGDPELGRAFVIDEMGKLKKIKVGDEQYPLSAYLVDPNVRVVTFFDDKGVQVGDVVTVASGMAVGAPAEPAKREGYTFAGWFQKDAETAYDFSAAVNEDLELYGKWTVNKYEIAVAANDSKMGSVKGAGTYEYGTEVELVATAAEGYKFSNWEDDVKASATRKVKVTAAASYKANFEKIPESSSSSAKEDKSSSSTKPKSSSSSTKPKSSSSKTDAIVATAAIPQFCLSIAGRNVQIAGARVGSAYAVLDMQGRVLATGRTASASMEIAVPRAGSYMVRVGSQTKRVNVK